VCVCVCPVTHSPTGLLHLLFKYVAAICLIVFNIKVSVCCIVCNNKVIHNLKLSWQLNLIKYFWASGHVRSLKGK